MRVVSSARLPAPIAAILGASIDYREPAEQFSRAQLLAELAEADGLITLLSDAVNDELLAAAPRLRVVANYAVGYDNIDLAAASRRGIAVCNTPGVLTEATADLTWALLLGAARRVVAGDALVRSGAWAGWFPDQLLGWRVHGRTLGIVGLGRIGAAVARRGLGFGMRILYSGPRPAAVASELGAERVSLDELLADSHVISLHCPLTPDTRHLIGADALSRMREDAILINTARGAIIDEPALIDALESGRIAAAGLDVFENEPEVPHRLRCCQRAVLAPHIGSATTDTRRLMGETCAQAVLDVLSGRRPAPLVNRDWSPARDPRRDD